MEFSEYFTDCFGVCVCGGEGGGVVRGLQNVSVFFFFFFFFGGGGGGGVVSVLLTV